MKSLVNLLHPFGVAWLGVTVLLVLLWRRRREARAAWRVALGSWIFVTITGWTPLAERLLASLERPWAEVNWDKLPQTDALLMLGGGANGTLAEMVGLDMNNASDRVMTAIELMRRGNSPVMVLGGSIEPSVDYKPSEGVSTEKLIRQWNLTQAPIYQLGVCANTYEEALAMRKLVDKHGWKSVLLVTSASHMRRAAAVFRKQGVPVVEVACGFRSRVRFADRPAEWISTPDANKVDMLTIWLQEHIGYWVYWLRGWV
jgi:uncharacterized SAM-binding protein YcdF (DUF218 family)